MIHDGYLTTILDIWSEKGKRTTNLLCGNSMAPLLRHGDRVVIEHGKNKIRPGDIVVYKGDNKVCAHRFIRTRQICGKSTFLFKGDNCVFLDPPVRREQIIGKIIEVKGKNGSLRLNTIFWKMMNCLLARFSYASAVAGHTNSKLYKLVQLPLKVNSKIFLNGNSHWTTFLHLVARLFRMKHRLRVAAKNNSIFCISSSGRLCPIFNGNLLKIVQLFLWRFHFRSNISDPNLSAKLWTYFLPRPLKKQYQRDKHGGVNQ